jgi:acyl-[acyl carrier protein]--UDP-N-acetylglucosamine O-acyltransferase
MHHTRQVSSMNLIGLRRAGYQSHVDALKKAFYLLYRNGHTMPKAVELILGELGHDPLCRELAEFVQASEHGISQYGNWKD